MATDREFERIYHRTLTIGSPVPRVDAYDKVTGAEKYAADYYSPDMLWAGVKRAGAPHARLMSINLSNARRHPGVHSILTYADIKGANRQGVIRKDQRVLADEKVRHCGDAVALVLAESQEALSSALDLIELELEPLPAVFDAEQAIQDGAPRVHDDHPGGNVLIEGHLKTGEGEDAQNGCDVMVEASFKTPRQEHAYLETEAGWAQVGDDGRLTIVCSTQTPFRDRMEVAEALGLEPTAIRIIAPYPGGAFGGKDGVTVQSLLGLAALHAGGRPVKMWWDRESSFLASTKRHAAAMYYRLGAKTDGSLHYLGVRLYLDTGPYDLLGGVVLTQALEHSGGPYRIPNVVLDGWCAYTNNPIGGAFRGFGVPQVTAAMEQVMDMLSEKLGMDPLELRRKNAVKRGEKNCVGKTLVHSTGVLDCLDVAASHRLWKEREAWKSSAGPFNRRGVGISAVMQASGYGPVVPDVANAKIELTSEGTIRVYCGVVDMGQGSASTNLQIVGSILGQDSARIELIQPDTDRTLPSGSASASRCTYSFGNALIGAAQTLKERIIRRAADFLMAPDADHFVLAPGAVRYLRTGQEMPLSVLARFLNESERIAVHRFRAPVAGEILPVGENLRLHGFPHTLFSYGVHVAWVAVDELTGAVSVEKYLAVSDCGTIINPQNYEQQIQGAISQGIGFALSEEFEVKDGRVVTSNLSTYLIPTSVDVPEIESVPVQLYEQTGPFGLKGVGEIAMNGPLPAVANAVADACGMRVITPPLTPERVLEAWSRKGLADRADGPASDEDSEFRHPNPLPEG